MTFHAQSRRLQLSWRIFRPGFYYSTAIHHEIRLIRGCIGQIETNALVTSSNRRLEGNASKRYWRHAGRRNADGEVRRLGDTEGRLTAACKEVLRTGILNDREVTAVATGCFGELHRQTKAHRIIHAMAPDAYSDVPGKEEEYRRLVTDVLSLASSDIYHDSSASSTNASNPVVQTITMPALGCGVKGWTAAQAAECAVLGMADYLWTRSEIDPPLSLVIVLFGDATARAWALVFEKMWRGWPELSSLPVKLQIDESCLRGFIASTVVSDE